MQSIQITNNIYTDFFKETALRLFYSFFIVDAGAKRLNPESKKRKESKPHNDHELVKTPRAKLI